MVGVVAGCSGWHWGEPFLSLAQVSLENAPLQI